MPVDDLDTRLNSFGWEDRWDNFAGPQAKAFHLLKGLDLGHSGSALRQAGQIVLAMSSSPADGARHYRRNPIVLANHDRTKPIARRRSNRGEAVYATIEFAQQGVSSEADKSCGLAKAGVLGAGSVGFRPIKSEPIRGELGGERFLAWELLELSLCSVPAIPASLSSEGRCTASPVAF